MNTIRFDIHPPALALRQDVDCICVIESNDDEALSVHVSPGAVPGILFQHSGGRSSIASIVTASAATPPPPTLFVYAAGTEASTMHFTPGPRVSMQVILKPHALNSLLRLNAAALPGGYLELDELAHGSLNEHMLNARTRHEQITLLTRFLVEQLDRAGTRDTAIEESLRLIHSDIACVTVKSLLDCLNLSERQFERRFRQTVGISPQSYIRVRRFNEAVRLIKTRRYARLTDIAAALNFYDQSHLIRDIRTFAGITPKDVSQKDNAVYDDMVGFSYL